MLSELGILKMGGGGSAGDAKGGGDSGGSIGGYNPIHMSGAFWPCEQGLERPCDYGDGLGGSADLEGGWNWDA